MFFIRQGATHKIVVGPVVAVANGYVPVTTLALTTADEAEVIVHDSATVVDISAYTFAAVTTADGYYVLTLQSGISGTVGHMTVLINDDSLCLPVKAEFTVVEEAVYDAFYAASATGVPAAGALEATAQSILTDTAVIGAAGAGLTALATQASVNTIDDFLDTEIAAILSDTNAILVDTGTTLQAELDAIQAAVITNAAGVDIAADIIALKAETAAILVDTGTTLDAALAVVDANVDSILADTGTDGVVVNAAGLAADAVTEIRAIVSGTADSGTTTTMVDAARTEADTDYWKDMAILFTSGTISGQARLITAFDAATDTITFSPATTQAVGTNTYEIISNVAAAGATAPTAAEVADAVWDEDATAHQTLGTFGQAIGDPAADTTTIYQAVITDAAGTHVAADIIAIEAQTDDIGIAGAGLTAVPWNAAWDAEVQSEVDDALVA